MSNNGLADITQIFYDLFASRTDVYAIKILRKDGAKIFVPHRDRDGNDSQFTKDVCWAHLMGKKSIGGYPLNKDNTVIWAAIDFDGKRGDAFTDSLIVKKTLAEKAGLISWREISQSGKGIHLWIFFNNKIQAKIVRHVLGEFIPEFYDPIDSRSTSLDRLFPNQDTILGGYGNLCGLPLNGKLLIDEHKTVFINDENTPYKDQKDILRQIYTSRNNPVVLLELAKTIKPKARSQSSQVSNLVPGGIKLLSPVGCAWLRSAFQRAETLSEPEWREALVQFSKLEGGEHLAQKFSEPYKDYDPNDVKKKFETIAAKNPPPQRCETIWKNFGDCGKRCAHLNVHHPWELAKVSLTALKREGKGKIYTIKELIPGLKESVQEVVEGKRTGFAWGYPPLDDATELRPRNLIIVAARQGIGKSGIMVDVSYMGAKANIPQYIFSREMAHEELMFRYLARASEIDHSIITVGRLGKPELATLEDIYKTLSPLPIYIDDTTLNLDKMLDIAGELIYKHGHGPIWVDYLQLIHKENRESKKEAVDRAVDAYKEMSKLLEVPVIAIAQLNRMEEFAEGDDDLDSWLKDSGDIEQTADVIHYIRGPRGPGTIERRWRLHKERHRASGINFKFLLHQGIFKYEAQGFWRNLAVSEEDIEDNVGLGFDAL